MISTQTALIIAAVIAAILVLINGGSIKDAIQAFLDKFKSDAALAKSKMDAQAAKMKTAIEGAGIVVEAKTVDAGVKNVVRYTDIKFSKGHLVSIVGEADKKAVSDACDTIAVALAKADLKPATT